MPDILLQVENLSVAFAQQGKTSQVLHNISFDINSGETVAVVGESGSGKSVTSLSIMRLLPEPSAQIGGNIFLYKEDSVKDLVQLNDKAMCHIRGKDIAMIFQEPMSSLNPVLTCGFQVSEAIQVHEKINAEAAKKRTLELFERVKLPDSERAYRSFPHQLSGGQIQRVMIAMAISCKPQLLIADEPTTALDVTVQKSILELLQDLQSEFGMSILFITHDLGIVKEIADRVIVMYKGRIVENNISENIFLAPQHPYTKGLLACKPKLTERPERLRTVNDYMEVHKNADNSISFTEKNNALFKQTLVSAAQTSERLNELMTRKPLIEVSNLCIDYPAKKNFWGIPTAFTHAVNNVSFAIYPGETLGLVGESGCGKTSLGRSLVNLTPATSGSIKFNGEELTSATAARWRILRCDIQIVFQDPFASLNPRITIGNAILEPLEVHRVLNNNKARKEKVMQLLGMVGLLPEHFNRYPHEFSGGQRQRICIARALALNPKFIVFDESVSALDVSVQAQVLNLLVDLRRQFNFTCIFISHDLSVVKFISDRIMVMQKGRIIEVQAADALYSNPKALYTQQLIEAIP